MSSIKLWASTVLAAILVFVVAREIPEVYEGAKNERLLQQHGVTRLGRVIAHSSLPPGKGCRTQADIGYSVQGSTYTIRITGCGASAASLPVGREVDVRYLPFNPAIAAAAVPGAGTPTYSWVAIFFMLGSLIFLLVALCREWMKAAKKK
jgi:hypothetical protein